jgi:hypothetical protein
LQLLLLLLPDRQLARDGRPQIFGAVVRDAGHQQFEPSIVIICCFNLLWRLAVDASSSSSSNGGSSSSICSARASLGGSWLLALRGVCGDLVKTRDGALLLHL